MSTIHIYFNGRGAWFPQFNEWEKFRELDAVRTFLICADSWRNAGWKVKRFFTMKRDPDGYMHFSHRPQRWGITEMSRVCRQWPWYSREHWEVIPRLIELCEDDDTPIHCATMDVINRGFMPTSADVAWMRRDGHGCVSYQQEHFSMSCFSATRPWLRRALEILHEYDRGGIPAIRADYISDERILREYADYQIIGFQKFACNPGTQPLVHYARSTVARCFDACPSSFS